jgi:hypothetical protein
MFSQNFEYSFGYPFFMFPTTKRSLFTTISNSLVPPKYASVNGQGVLTVSELKLVYFLVPLFSAAYIETVKTVAVIVFYAS